jgi:hypothetical protein
MNPSRNFKSDRVVSGQYGISQANLAYAYHATRLNLLRFDPRFQDLLLGAQALVDGPRIRFVSCKTGDCAPWTNLRSFPLTSAQDVDAISPVFSGAKRPNALRSIHSERCVRLGRIAGE